MAKFASIVALLFAALVLFAAFGDSTEAVRKAKWNVSGVCGNNNACKNQCIRLEKARHGSCNYVFPAHKCICYFPC
ncbi:unnamed protein product [Brassica rapa]|uniref:Knottins-like domain-containing protein n=2 Tax=Brassica TaxID=3705 RepID=A0A8D9MBT7_BRACM|nr:unnamed protein product [Brassica napus]CAG7904707.1 unnamed protein product [Brassica rapa]